MSRDRPYGKRKWKPRCPRCERSHLRYRLRTSDYVCVGCGLITSTHDMLEAWKEKLKGERV